MSTATVPASTVKGVGWKASKSRWTVSRYRGGKREFLGTFKDQAEAEAVSQAWELKQRQEPEKPPAPRWPTLGRSSLTQYQVEYAMSLAPTIRGF